MGKRKKSDEVFTLSSGDDATSPIRKSQRKKSKPAKYTDSVTPEKIPTVAPTPRKSRRSKDMSPPPLRHHKNQMPEQMELVKGECKCSLLFFDILLCYTVFASFL